MKQHEWTEKEKLEIARRSQQWAALTDQERLMISTENDEEWDTKLSDQGRYLPYIRQVERATV